MTTGPQNLAAVIFDFDGLLMDTESTLLRSWQAEWAQWGLELDPTTFFADHGGDMDAVWTSALADAVGPGFDPDVSRRRRREYRRELQRTLGLRPGIRGWLRQAADAGLRLAVASSSRADWLRENLGRVGVVEKFEVLAGGDEVAHAKPEPDVYRLALRRLDLTADRAVAVEDTPHGVRAARRAGLACIAIPNPHVDVTRLRSADLVLGSARDARLAEAAARALAASGS